MLIRSMRFRLTLLFLALFAGAQAVLWLLVDRVRTDNLFAEFDRQLVRRAQGMVEVLEPQGDPARRSDFKQTMAAALRPFEATDFFFQVRDVQGRSILRSRNLTGFDLPFDRHERPPDNSGDGPSFRTITFPWEDALVGAGAKLRLVTMRGEPVGGRAFYLQAAVDLRPVLEGVSASRRLLVVFGFVSLVLAALTAWFVTGRSLSPLRDLTRTAKRVSAAKLGERSDIDHASDEVGTAIDAVNDMLDRLEREFNSLERFVSNISHELKTPLSVLLGEAQALARQPERQDGHNAFVGTVEQEARRLLKTIEAFLILARAKARVRLPVTQNVSLEDTALDAMQTMRATAAEKGIRILSRFDATDGVDEPYVAGDRDLIRSMLENLLQNAIRHSPPDTPVDLQIACTLSHARLTVRDRGPGIPNEQLDIVFDRFHQFDREGTRTGSAGLGLAIVKAVADLHGGNASARNMHDGGCEIGVTLPLACPVPQHV